MIVQYMYDTNMFKVLHLSLTSDLEGFSDTFKALFQRERFLNVSQKYRLPSLS